MSGPGHDHGMDDLGVGRRFRAVRTHKRMRQLDVSEAAGVSRAGISRIEHGRFDSVTLETVRRVARALDISVGLVARWHGGDLDRMVNARHAALHETAALRFASLPGWIATPEVSFNVYGDTGAVDVLCWHAERRMCLVVELKSEIVDVQGMIGALDRYRRLAPRIARDRGWDPVTVSTWVAIAAGRANERALATHRTVLRTAFPCDGRRLAAWLRDPIGRIDALTFLPYAHGLNVGRDLSTPRRVRPRSRPR
jgi:transcriptional regulator with XRE-family HTH domain